MFSGFKDIPLSSNICWILLIDENDNSGFHGKKGQKFSFCSGLFSHGAADDQSRQLAVNCGLSLSHDTRWMLSAFLIMRLQTYCITVSGGPIMYSNATESFNLWQRMSLYMSQCKSDSNDTI